MTRGFAAVACLSLLWSPVASAQPEPTLVHRESTATWFEDDRVRGVPTPDGRALILSDWRHRKVVDLETSRTMELDSLAPANDLDRLYGLRFLVDGRVVLYGVRGEESGWFLPGPGGYAYTGLPPNASPDWAPGSDVAAWVLGRGDTLQVGRPGSARRVDLGGPIRATRWAPGGETVFALVAIGTGESGRLVRVDPGSLETRVVRRDLHVPIGAGSIALAPDGSRLYLALASSTLTAPEVRHDPLADRDLDIWAIDPAIGEAEVVVAHPASDFAPVVRGDALYWTRNDHSDAIALVPVKGGSVEILLDDAILPTWGPAGERLAFTRGGGGADGVLSMDGWVAQVEPKSGRLGPATPLASGLHEDFTPVFSPGGQWIAYHSHRSTAPVAVYAGTGTSDDLYLRRPGAPAEEEIRLTDFGWEVGMPDWAPDGRRIVFDSWERGGRPGISKPWIATIDPADGTLLELERVPLPEGVESATMPAWSPDGKRIAFEVRSGSGKREIWLLRPDGSEPHRLVGYESRTYGGLDWTPDGRFVVYAGLAGDRMQLFRIRVDGGTPERLTDDEENVLHPRVSPDGRWIAASRLKRAKEVWRLGLPASPRRRASRR